MIDENYVQKFFESRKNANCILELEKNLLSEDENSVLSSLDVVKDLFIQVFERNMFSHSNIADKSEQKFKDWLIKRYEDFISHLFSYLSHGNKEIQIKAFKVLIKFVCLEGKYPLTKVDPGEWYFPKLLFQKILSEILSSVLDQHNLILKLKLYLSYVDIRIYTLKAVTNILNVKEEANEIFLNNCCYVLSSCCPTSEDSITLLSQEGVDKPFTLKKKLFAKVFSNAWRIFLTYQLPLPLLKKVLVVLPKKVMKHFQNPSLLTDFFTDLYSKGGLISLLALSGLFELMQKYNVEYPDFYLKLYSLFDEKIVNGKFGPRFFYLSDLFLSSTHLPAYMVAAFVKRLSRLSLWSKTDCLLKIIPLICNLLIRHPTLNVLIHRTDLKDISEDPYDFNATDPVESRAIESSLWEIRTLQSHINPDVSRKAKLINCELPKLEFDLSIVLDITIDSVYKKERKRKFSGVPTAVEKPLKTTNLFILSNKVIT